MADKYLVVFTKKYSPHKSDLDYVMASKPFPTKTDARKFILKILRTKKQFMSATIYTTGEIGEHGQFLNTGFETFSTSRESITSVTVKNKKAYYVNSTFRNPLNKDKIVNDDGTLSNVKINDWIAKRDPHYWDLDIDPEKIKQMLKKRSY